MKRGYLRCRECHKQTQLIKLGRRSGFYCRACGWFRTIEFTAEANPAAKQFPHSGTCADVEAVLVETVKKLRTIEVELSRHHLSNGCSNTYHNEGCSEYH